MKIQVFGSGAWGTALAVFLARIGHDVTIAGRDTAKNIAMSNKRENSLHLPGVEFPENLTVLETMEPTGNEDAYLFSIPTSYLRETIKNISGSYSLNACFITASKGIEQSSLDFPSQIISEGILEADGNNIAVLSGPNFAKEVAGNKPTATTIASTNKALVQLLIKEFSSDTFRGYGNEDVIGVELAGALKNIYAIAVGISDGMQCGDNARAALITRSMAEMMRLGTALGAKTETFLGLSGYGDLILTCTGDLSRNRNVGLYLGRGKDYRDYLKEHDSVAEGVHTVKAALELAKKHGVQMPVAEEVFNIIYNGKKASESLKTLLQRDPKDEFY